MKAFLFVCQELSRDIECQIKGVVIIGFPLDRDKDSRPNLNPVSARILKDVSQKIVPVRIAAFHCCIEQDPWFRLASTLLMRALPRQFRLRARIHMGKHSKRMDALL